MSLVSASPRTLGDVVPGGLVRNVALVVGGTLFVALSALVQIPLPFTPVPLSLQTFAVLLAGAALGSRRGAMSMGLYLLAGVAGVPWFSAHQSGWTFPSFGYVVGFVAAAWLAGRLAEAGADRQVLKNTGLMVVGNVVIYAFGVTWLHNASAGMTWGQAVHYGFVVFLISDALKLVVAALAFPAAWKFARR